MWTRVSKILRFAASELLMAICKMEINLIDKQVSWYLSCLKQWFDINMGKYFLVEFRMVIYCFYAVYVSQSKTRFRLFQGLFYILTTAGCYSFNVKTVAWRAEVCTCLNETWHKCLLPTLFPLKAWFCNSFWSCIKAYEVPSHSDCLLSLSTFQLAFLTFQLALSIFQLAYKVPLQCSCVFILSHLHALTLRRAFHFMQLSCQMSSVSNWFSDQHFSKNTLSFLAVCKSTGQNVFCSTIAMWVVYWQSCVLRSWQQARESPKMFYRNYLTTR